MSQFYCQHYSALVENLTSAEKAVITRIYPVITILKLKLNSSFNLGSYKDVCAYFMFLPQNSGQLLTLLPSKTTLMDNVV